MSLTIASGCGVLGVSLVLLGTCKRVYLGRCGCAMPAIKASISGIEQYEFIVSSDGFMSCFIETVFFFSDWVLY